MSVLYTNIPPIVPWNTDVNTIDDKIEKLISQADKVEIVVGYVSTAALDMLDKWVHEYELKSITLIAGMYKVSGIPESIYNRATDINEKWKQEKIGSILFVKNMDYHGKIYSFWKTGVPFATVIGSANLSVIAPTSRQFEVATIITDKADNKEFANHIKSIIETSCTPANELDDFEVIHERMSNLRGITKGEIIEISNDENEVYKEKETKVQFKLPIKAPKFEKRFSENRSDYASSNINVCYGKGRRGQNGKTVARNWYEVQVTVAKDITMQQGYPQGGPFYVVTDDGYKFEAHTTADNFKQFTAYGAEHNDRVLGRWIKGRLVATGLLKAQDSADSDEERLGVVTQEMLRKAHMENMVLTKTTAREMGRVFNRLKPTLKNKKGAIDKKHSNEQLLEVWTIHFESSESDGNE